jgi:hypothetical protein
MDPTQITARRLCHALRILQQSPGQERDDGDGKSLGQLPTDRRNGGRGQDELVGPVGGPGRSDRTSSLPRTTSPAR